MDQNLKTDAITLTKTLCGHLAAAQFRDLTERAKREARRGVLDWIGCALAGSGHRTVTTLLSVLQETSGKPVATVLGRKLKLGLLDAPLANGQMGHVLDLRRHPHGRRRAAHQLAGAGRASGCRGTHARERRRVHAGLCGGLRGRRALGPHRAGPPQGRLAPDRHARLDRGRHRCGKAPESRHAEAHSRDGNRGDPQAAGMQQNRGTMCKSFHAGKAASNGVMAALLAERGFDSTQEIIEGKKGFSRIYSDVAEPEALLAGLDRGLGRSQSGWLIESNGHKPYACGIVLHPLDRRR